MIIKRIVSDSYDKMLDLRKPNVNLREIDTTLKNLKSSGLDYSASELYAHNSDGFRSDEFSKVHDGKHILFAGCSVTYGVGMTFEQSWPYKTYTKISESTKASGFFNIAYPGAKIIDIPNQIYKYINKYGTPDTIFINLPDIRRDYRVVEDMTYSRGLDHKPVDMTLQFVHRAIFELNNYCKSVGIDLVMITWTHFDYEDLKIDRSTFYYKKFLNAHSKDKVFYPLSYMKNLFVVSKKDEIKFIHDFYVDNQNLLPKDFLVLGFDGHHPGIAFHELYSQIAMYGYEVVKNENI